jgi:rhodanese-related sulfurtransferase
MKKTFSGMVEESRGQLDIIDSHALNKMIENKEDMVILDVNDKEDVEQRGMVDGAINISLGTLYYKADDSVPDDFKDSRIQNRDKKVVVTCGLGMCAAIGGKVLKDMGFKDVVLLEGGVAKYKEDGYELKK